MGLGQNVHRLGDICTGHGSWPPRNSTEGSLDVSVNGIPVHRLGDAWTVHCRPGSNPDCHSSVLESGSSTVNVNGLQMARIGDPVACGSDASAASCSPTVFCGG